MTYLRDRMRTLVRSGAESTLREHEMEGVGTAYRIHPLPFREAPVSVTALSGATHTRTLGDALVRARVRTEGMEDRPHAA